MSRLKIASIRIKRLKLLGKYCFLTSPNRNWRKMIRANLIRKIKDKGLIDQRKTFIKKCRIISMIFMTLTKMKIELASRNYNIKIQKLGIKSFLQRIKNSSVSKANQIHSQKYKT